MFHLGINTYRKLYLYMYWKCILPLKLFEFLEQAPQKDCRRSDYISQG